MPPRALYTDDEQGLRNMPSRASSRVRGLGVPLSRYATFETDVRPLSIISEQIPLLSISPLPAAEPDATPLPALSMTVLSIALLGEFLTACVSMPFLLFMVEGFGEFEEGDVGFYAGVLVSAFFLGQFITSVPWSSFAARHNPRLVLTLSLAGASLSCATFGLCTSFRAALAVRFAQGLFAGAAGVARSCVGSVTDASNESRAYAIIGFFWGVGGVLGSVIGGMFESPAQKWPAVAGSIPLFVDYPYVLPTVLAASVPLVGAILSLFLAPDGGPRHRVPLLAEKLDIAPFTAIPIPPTIPEHQPLLSTPAGYPSTLPEDIEPNSRFARNHYGAVHFRDASPARNRPRGASVESVYRRLKKGVTASRTSLRDAANSLVERVVEAQESRVSSISDLWVAAALSTEILVPDMEEIEEYHKSDFIVPSHMGNLRRQNTLEEGETFGEDAAPVTPRRSFGIPMASRDGTLGDTRSLSLQDVFFDRRQAPYPAGLGPLPSDFGAPMRVPRRMSRSSFRTHTAGPRGLSLARTVTYNSVVEMRTRTLSLAPTVPEEEEEAGLSSLPWPILAQYGILALHTVMHDMIFMPFFVTKHELGGLNRTAADFSQLTALMCLFQIAYQFFLYPLLSGRLSHLSVLRLGCLLYIPAYLGTTLLHFLASPENEWRGLDLGAGLVLTQAIRYCGNTISFTAVAILINCMSPPSALGLANGVGQGIVSLGRCIGPVLGGYIWSTSMNGNPNGFYLPFFTLMSMVVFALVNSLAF